MVSSWFVNSHVLAVASLGLSFCACMEKERGGRDLVSLLLVGTPILSDQGPNLKTSFNLNDFLKPLLSKSSHIEG